MTQPDHAPVAAEVARLQTLSVDELRVEFRRYTGEEPRSRNRQWLFRRTAWAFQASIFGGLSPETWRRIEELMPTAELALRTPKAFRPELVTPTAPVRDARLPKPGVTLIRHYRGERVAVEVLKDGFEWEGRRFRSLSAVAHAVTGSRWNGLLFFNCALRNRANAAHSSKNVARGTDRRPALTEGASPSDEDGRKGDAKPETGSDASGT